MIESFFKKLKILSKLHPNEIPSLTQIYKNGIFLADSFNQVEKKSITHLHSEILCIEISQKILNTKFLDNCVMLTSIEPCLMCTGAIIQARIEEVIYFLGATKTEGITSLSIESIYSKNHFPKLTLYHSNEVESLVKEFFKDKR